MVREEDPTVDMGIGVREGAALRERYAGVVVAGRYRLIAPIAAGGMGAVFEAEQLGLGRRVAVKVLHPACSAPDLAARFEREARLASAIDHPNVVEVHDFVRLDDGEAAIVMELVRGVSLADVLREEDVLEPARAVRLVLPILSALARAHELGVVHRDVKPGNVMISQVDGLGEIPKLVDFGIAKAASDVPLTCAGHLLGTPLYMAPEQAAGGTIDGRADLYSVGAMLYRMLTGELLVRGESLPELIDSIVNDVAAPLRCHDASLPAELEPVLARALAKRPEDRFSSALEMARALEDALAAVEARALVVPVVCEVPVVREVAIFRPSSRALAFTPAPVAPAAAAPRASSPISSRVAQIVVAKAAALAVAAGLLFGVASAWASVTGPTRDAPLAVLESLIAR